jgi:hypothetical protein
MGIYDKAIHADLQEMVHREGDDGPSSDLQERLGASLCQGAEPRAQPGTQDKRRLEPPLLQNYLTGKVERWNTGILGKNRMEVRANKTPACFLFICGNALNILAPGVVIASPKGVAISFFVRLLCRPAKRGTPRNDKILIPFVLVCPILPSFHYSIHPDVSVFFLPNAGSIFTSAVTMKPGIVAAMTHRK